MHKIAENREQLRTVTLDDFVDLYNPVRILDIIIDEVIYKGNIEIPTGKNRFGRRAFSAKDLVKLYIYGYINGTTSCRALEKAARINIEIIWLIKGQKPSYKTISDFRKNNPLFIKEVFQKSIALLMDKELIGNRTWVLDGHKVKGNAKRDMLSVKKLRKQVQETEEEIEQLMKELTEERSNSEKDDDPEGGASSSRKLSELIESHDNNQSLISEVESQEQKFFSPTDKDALLVKTRRGKCAGFNTQIVVDDTHHLIVGVDLADVSADSKSLYSVIKSTSDAIEVKPATVLADRGYTNFQDIRRVYEEITNGVIVMLQQTSRDKSGLDFKYDSENNHVICPRGNVMKYKGKALVRGVFYRAYQCKVCNACPIRKACTRSKGGRIYRISENQYFIEMYKELMRREDSLRAMKRRKTIVEHVFGTMDQMMHYNGFKLRGRAKVKTELYLYSLAYNMKRLFKLLSSPQPGDMIGKLRLCGLKNALLTYFSSFYALIRLILDYFTIKSNPMPSFQSCR
jgi:transposase